VQPREKNLRFTTESTLLVPLIVAAEGQRTAFASLAGMLRNPTPYIQALEILKDDHARIKGLFDLLRQSDDADERRTLFQSVKDELEAHTQLEEKIAYPRFAEFDDLADFIDEYYDEHQEMKDILDEIDEVEAEAEGLDSVESSSEEPVALEREDLNLKDLYEEMDSALEELIELVNVHVDEEENQLFPKIREFMSEEELMQLGRSMLRAKEQLRAA
jgi:hemerythrin superfamily protein